MKREKILETLQEMIMPYLDHPCAIEMESDLLNDLRINSIDLVHIVAEIEDFFKCSIYDEQMFHMRLVKDLVQFLSKET